MLSHMPRSCARASHSHKYLQEAPLVMAQMEQQMEQQMTQQTSGTAGKK